MRKIKQKDKKEMVKELVIETKNVYDRNINNSNLIDTKIAQLFTFITALTVLFINFIKIDSKGWGILLYVIPIGLFITSLFILIQVYKPMPYQAIDPNALITKYYYGRYKSNIKLMEAIAGTTAENIISLKENINKKVKFIDWCVYFTIIGLIMLVIIKIIKGA